MKTVLITGANKSIGFETAQQLLQMGYYIYLGSRDTIVLAYELRDTAFKVNVVDPGYTATDFNHHSGPGTVEDDAAATLVRAATLGADGPTSQFSSDDNEPVTGISPW